MKPLACLLFVAAIVLGVSSRCPPHWMYFGGDCYGYGDSVVSWPDAQVICQTRGAKLAEVPSLQENFVLTSIARETNAYCVWLGGNDIFKEGTWEWASSLNTFTGFTNWTIGQPDDFEGVEDCLNLPRNHNYAWNDSPCNIGCNFICSKPSNGTDVANGK